MNRSEVIELVTYISYSWPSFRPPAEEAQLSTFLDVWESHLGDLDARAVRAAVDDLALEGSAFGPAPGQLRRRVAELPSSSGVATPDADTAWAEIKTNIARVGWTVALGAKLEWSHPAIESAVKSMGWP